MTMVVPAAPAGAHAPRSNGEAASARADDGAPDFAAALADTAGDIADQDGESPLARTLNDAMSVRPPHDVDGREHRGAPKGSKSDLRSRIKELLNPKGGGPPDLDGIVRPEPKAPDGPIVNKPPEPFEHGKPGDPEPTPIPPSEGMGPQANAVRDALAALGVDRPTTPNATAAAGELMAQPRRSASLGAPPLTGGGWNPKSGEKSDLPSEVPDIPVTEVKVARQETHFQPVGQEARRLLEMTAAADELAPPVSLAAAAKAGRPQAPERGQPDAPAAPARATEPSGTIVQPILGKDEAGFGTIAGQIADSFSRAVGPPSAGEATARAAPAEPIARPEFAAPVRSIKLQLNPASLGMVTIVLTGGEGDMRVHVEAERAETLGKVEQERSALSARLNGAGYAISELTVGRMGSADAQMRDADQRDAAARQGGPSGDAAGSGARDGASHSSDERAGRQAPEQPYRSEAPAPRAKAIEQAVPGISYAGRFRPV